MDPSRDPQTGPTWSEIFNFFFLVRVGPGFLKIFWFWSESVLDLSNILALVRSGPIFPIFFGPGPVDSGPWIPRPQLTRYFNSDFGFGPISSRGLYLLKKSLISNFLLKSEYRGWCIDLNQTGALLYSVMSCDIELSNEHTLYNLDVSNA